jgi:hypothetical protein
MKKLIVLAAAAALLAALPAGAADPVKAADKPAKEEPKAGGETQQNRMKSCNAEASKKQLKGDERRAFMSTCLKG